MSSSFAENPARVLQLIVVNLTTKVTERIVYAINIIFVFVTIGVSSIKLSESGEKEIFIYLAWILLGIYFTVLSFTFYEVNVKNGKEVSRTFKVASSVPMIYLAPATLLHGFALFYTFDLLSLAITLGGTLWISATILNLMTEKRIKPEQRNDNPTSL